MVTTTTIWSPTETLENALDSAIVPVTGLEIRLKKGKAIFGFSKGTNRAGHFIPMATMLFLALTTLKFRRASRQIPKGTEAKALEPPIISRPDKMLHNVIGFKNLPSNY